MAGSNTVAKLNAGTTIAWDRGSSPSTFTTIPQVLSIGTVGEKGEFIETTPISATTREYIPGIDEPSEKQFTLNIIDGNTDQQNFLADAQARITTEMQVTYPNGRVGNFSCVLNGYEVDEADVGTQMKVIVYARQTGAVTWS